MDPSQRPAIRRAAATQLPSERPPGRGPSCGAGPPSRRRRGRAAVVGLLASLGVLAAAGPAAAATTGPAGVAAASATQVSGSRTALVITVALRADTQHGLPRTEPGASVALIADDVVDNTRQWFSTASHGIFSGFYSLRRGSVDVQTTQPLCSGGWLKEIADQADAAVLRREPNLDLGRFSPVIYYFGRVPVCAAPNPYSVRGNAGWTEGQRTWLNGDHTRRTAVHELGHVLGLEHSGVLECHDAGGHVVPLSADCTYDEYGDLYSAMGGLLTDSYSPWQLRQLGWNNGHVATLRPEDVPAGAPKHVDLTTAEDDVPGSTQALQLWDGSSLLWLEYRRGPAISESPALNGGLLVRRAPLLGGTPTPALLTMSSPSGGGGPSTPHPEMAIGQTWANPLGTMRVTLDSFDITGANVTISSSFVPAPPVDLRTVPDVRGDLKWDAVDRIRGSGLAVGTVTTRRDPGCEQLGRVVDQTPAAGTRLPPGSRVDIVEAIAPRSGCPTPH